MSDDAQQPTVYLSLEQILGADDLEERDVFIEAWGGSVRIRALSRATVRRINRQGVDDPDSVEKSLLCQGMVSPVISPTSYDKLDAKRAGAVEQIIAAIMDLSDIGTSAKERALKSFRRPT